MREALIRLAMMSGCGEAMLAAFAACWLFANCCGKSWFSRVSQCLGLVEVPPRRFASDTGRLEARG